MTANYKFIIDVMDEKGNISSFKTNDTEEYVEILALLKKNSEHHANRLEFVQEAEKISTNPN